MTVKKHARTVQVAIRFTPEEAEAVKAAARKKHWTFSQWVRLRALRGLEQDEQADGPK